MTVNERTATRRASQHQTIRASAAHRQSDTDLAQLCVCNNLFLLLLFLKAFTSQTHNNLLVFLASFSFLYTSDGHWTCTEKWVWSHCLRLCAWAQRLHSSHPTSPCLCWCKAEYCTQSHPVASVATIWIFYSIITVKIFSDKLRFIFIWRDLVE